MASLSKDQVESVLNLMEKISDIDPGVVLMANITIFNSEEVLIGDIAWNPCTNEFEWQQVA